MNADAGQWLACLEAHDHLIYSVLVGLSTPAAGGSAVTMFKVRLRLCFKPSMTWSKRKTPLLLHYSVINFGLLLAMYKVQRFLGNCPLVP